MTTTQQSKCKAIIHPAAAASGVGNLFPVPGVGVAADLIAMSLMAMQLAAVFGGSLTEEAAKAMAIASIKHTILKQPIRVLAKELSKLIPFLGQVVAPAISVAMVESAGWSMANELDRTFSPKTIPCAA